MRVPAFLPSNSPSQSLGALATAGKLQTNTRQRARSGINLAIGLLALVLLTWLSPSFSQDLAPAGKSAAANTTNAANTANTKPNKNTNTKPAWADLTAMQKIALKPLTESWDTAISEAQKRKWLELSKNYPQLLADDQLKLQSRMNEWIALSPQQRTEARLNFAKTQEISKKLSPEEKTAQWQTYQALSAEEKQKLAAKATADRHIGAAPAVKPVAPQKLATVQPKTVRGNAAEQPASQNKTPLLPAVTPTESRPPGDAPQGAASTTKN